MTPPTARWGFSWQGLRERLWAQRDRAFGLPVRDGVQIGGARPARLADFDHALVLVVLALVAFGLVMVYSASVALPDNPKFARYTPTFFLTRHLPVDRHRPGLCAGGGAGAGHLLGAHASLVFLVALVLLVIVLVPGIGKVVNFSRRWIPLGIMNFQPSELAKLAIAMYAASYMVRKMDVKENFVQAVWPMVVAVAFVGVLLLRQPDMGAFIVIATIAMGILFLGGVNGRMFFLIAAVLVATFALIIAFDDLRRERILAYLDPWNPKYVQGKAYQLTHSLIAIGRGEIFGQGLGASVEKLHYLPEAHTDFLLAVIGEELGFVGVAGRHRAVLLADAAHLRHRPPGHRAGPRVRRADGAGHRPVDQRAGLHQHGRQPGRAADQGPDAAADELRRLGHPDEPDRAGDRGARGPRERSFMRGGS
jgi:cell division protein FtsW